MFVVCICIYPICSFVLGSERHTIQNAVTTPQKNVVCLAFFTFPLKCVINKNVMSKTTYYISPIDCLLIVLDAHMFSHDRYGPGTKGLGPRSCVCRGLGKPAHWAWGLGPGPISSMAEDKCIKGNE